MGRKTSLRISGRPGGIPPLGFGPLERLRKRKSTASAPAGAESRACLARYVPFSGFLTLLRACSSRHLSALLHAVTLVGFYSSGHSASGARSSFEAGGPPGVRPRLAPRSSPPGRPLTRVGAPLPAHAIPRELRSPARSGSGRAPTRRGRSSHELLAPPRAGPDPGLLILRRSRVALLLPAGPAKDLGPALPRRPVGTRGSA